ncbi:MAG: hypothetical protein GY790_13195 [Bacteroidetes bacterium]|nr:hypothetical protein [Bacteroidota bacterium]
MWLFPGTRYYQRDCPYGNPKPHGLRTRRTYWSRKYKRGEDRQDYRNGYKSRTLYTHVGSLVLRVPQTREGQFYPSIMERYQRVEKALVLTLAEAYLQGVSTRKMKRVTEEFMGKEFSHTSISRFADRLEAELDPCDAGTF